MGVKTDRRTDRAVDVPGRPRAETVPDGAPGVNGSQGRVTLGPPDRPSVGIAVRP